MPISWISASMPARTGMLCARRAMKARKPTTRRENAATMAINSTLTRRADSEVLNSIREPRTRQSTPATPSMP